HLSDCICIGDAAFIQFHAVACCFFFSSRRRHTRSKRDWSSDVCSSDLPDDLYDVILKEIVGEEIRGRDHLLELMQDFAYAKKEYGRVADALQMVKQTGYGIASPSIEDMELDEPRSEEHTSELQSRFDLV